MMRQCVFSAAVCEHRGRFEERHAMLGRPLIREALAVLMDTAPVNLGLDRVWYVAHTTDSDADGRGRGFRVGFGESCL